MNVTNAAEFMKVDGSLKGLLMDKGTEGLIEKIRVVLRKLQTIQEAMEELSNQQRISREAAGSECMDMYLAVNLRKEVVKDESLKKISVGKLGLEHTRAPLILEWRARADFAQCYQLERSARVQPFNVDHAHYQAVMEYVNAKTPGYYATLEGYDAVRITLNNASKSLRKTAVDLSSTFQEVSYLRNNSKDAERFSKRIMKNISVSSQVSDVLQSLYCY